MSGATERNPLLIVGPCPCDSCRFRERCADQQLACAAYSMFLHSAKWQNVPRAPTRAIWEALLGERSERRGRPRIDLAGVARLAAPSRGASLVTAAMVAQGQE